MVVYPCRKTTSLISAIWLINNPGREYMKEIKNTTLAAAMALILWSTGAAANSNGGGSGHESKENQRLTSTNNLSEVCCTGHWWCAWANWGDFYHRNC